MSKVEIIQTPEGFAPLKHIAAIATAHRKMAASCKSAQKRKILIDTAVQLELIVSAYKS